MALDKQDIETVKLSRPVAIVDLWALDDRVARLEDAVNRLEKVVEALIEVYRTERVKNWELILGEMLKKEEQKKGNYGHRTG